RCSPSPREARGNRRRRARRGTPQRRRRRRRPSHGMRRMGVVSLVVAIALTACSASESALVRLDGSPRVPDDEGTATTLTRDKIVLDGRRTYAVDRRFVSFSTYTGALEPMVSRLGQ